MCNISLFHAIQLTGNVVPNLYKIFCVIKRNFTSGGSDGALAGLAWAWGSSQGAFGSSNGANGGFFRVLGGLYGTSGGWNRP